MGQEKNSALAIQYFNIYFTYGKMGTRIHVLGRKLVRFETFEESRLYDHVPLHVINNQTLEMLKALRQRKSML